MSNNIAGQYMHRNTKQHYWSVHTQKHQTTLLISTYTLRPDNTIGQYMYSDTKQHYWSVHTQ
jgi:hypothetical protein